jgi:hypothetical protein
MRMRMRARRKMRVRGGRGGSSRRRMSEKGE